GDLSREELVARTAIKPEAGSRGVFGAGPAAAAVIEPQLDVWLQGLLATRRVIGVRWGERSELRYIAVEDASRYRDALGVVLPPGLPESLLSAVADPLRDLSLRYARTHATFTLDEFAARFGLARAVAERALARLLEEGKLLEGAFRPGGTQRE